jgi:hypothetical protein
MCWYIPTLTTSEWASWVEATATTLAVGVALFGQEIIGLWRHPKLNVILRPGPPDCHKTEISIQKMIGQGVYEERYPCYYLRLWIENNGSTRAENVQVFAERLEKLEGHKYVEQKRFLPMNLRWSHSGAIGQGIVFNPGISPEMGAHADLAHIPHPSLEEQVAGRAVPGFKKGHSLLEFDLEVQPYQGGHLHGPGDYRLHLKVAASNCEPIKKVIGLKFSGVWHDSEETMFLESIRLTA